MCREISTRLLALWSICQQPCHAKCSGKRKDAPCHLRRKNEQPPAPKKPATTTVTKQQNAQVDAHTSLPSALRNTPASLRKTPHHSPPLISSTPAAKPPYARAAVSLLSTSTGSVWREKVARALASSNSRVTPRSAVQALRKKPKSSPRRADATQSQLLAQEH